MEKHIESFMFVTSSHTADHQKNENKDFKIIKL